jgi:hypothetical protein
MPDPKERRTASRVALPTFTANRQQLDWMHVPGMSTYVNGMVSGKDDPTAIHGNGGAPCPFNHKLHRPVVSTKMSAQAGCFRTTSFRALRGRHFRDRE